MALADKRARAVAKAWPSLARGLGDQYGERFAAYARVTPPPDAGALADGLAFSGVLARERRLPDDARIECMVVTARVKLRNNRLTARHGPWLAATITGPPHRLVVIVSVPPARIRLVALGPSTRPRLPQFGRRPRRGSLANMARPGRARSRTSPRSDNTRSGKARVAGETPIRPRGPEQPTAERASPPLKGKPS